MKPAIEFKSLTFDPQVVIAPVIYGHQPQVVTNQAVVLGDVLVEELQAFVSAYAEYIGLLPDYFFRLDAYFSSNQVQILEANASFVDGWGVALNLARAAGQPVIRAAQSFPRWFGLESSVYRPELELLVNELAALGWHSSILQDWRQFRRDEPTERVYVYGRLKQEDVRALPRNGFAMDSKLHLAQFGRYWGGYRVKVPTCYTFTDRDWEDLPEDVFLKFVDKDGPEVARARWSVKCGKPSGKAPFLRRCYNQGQLIAQRMVETQRVELRGSHRNVQLVILAASQVLTGYVQYGLGQIINDDSIHGPLVHRTWKLI